MQLAEILSDLTSLRVCDHTDALALVTVNETTSHLPPADKSTSESQAQGPAVPSVKKENDDLRRAKELVDLHYEIKAKHGDGEVDEELLKARADVAHVLRELGG